MFSLSRNLISFRTFVFNKSHSAGKPWEKRGTNTKIKILPGFYVVRQQQFVKVSSTCCQFCFLFFVFFATFCFTHISPSHYASLQPPALLVRVCSFTGWAPSLPASRGLRGRSWQAGISLFIARPSEQVKTRTMGTSLCTPAVQECWRSVGMQPVQLLACTSVLQRQRLQFPNYRPAVERL